MPWLRSPCDAPVPTGAADVEIDNAWRMPARQLPAVDVGREISALANSGGGCTSSSQRLTQRRHRAARLHRFGSFTRIARNGALVHVSDVGEIEQVVDDELIIRFDMKPAGSCSPLRLRQPRHVGKCFAVSALAARPSRSRSRSIFRRPDSYAPWRRTAPAPARYLDTLARHVKLKPVITARQVLARDLA